MRGDVIWAYIASVVRIASSAVVAGLLYRFAGAAEYAMLAMVRGTIGILNYTSLGLAPAMVRLLAEARSGSPKVVLPPDAAAELVAHEAWRRPRTAEAEVFSNGAVLAAASLLIGMIVTVAYAVTFHHLHVVPPAIHQMRRVVFWIGLGTMMRLASDAAGAVIQTRGRIALDNRLLASSEFVWLVFILVLGARQIHAHDRALLGTVAISFGFAGTYLLIARCWALARLAHSPWPPTVLLLRSTVLRRLATFGSLVLLANLADYLYAPTDYILINHFLTAKDVAAYAPAMQIDAGLLMVVVALAAVLLPKAAIAHTSGSLSVVRHYYLRGTLGSAATLIVAAISVWAVARPLLLAWFGANPPATEFILPLVLVHTVIGGSSAVGRSILLAMGRVKPFTAAVLIAGATNVIASYCFVRYLHWGLRGIVLGTIVAVVGRCAIWMPWYTLRTIRRELAR
jgi:O-antigen/teichoic acid export membrane protein